MIDWDRLELLVAIFFASLAKWFLTEEPPDEEEPATHAKVRRRRALGGIMAGMICGYYGHEPFLRSFDNWSEENFNDVILVSVFLTIVGEHVFRWAISLRSEAIGKFFQRIFFPGGES